MAGAPPALVDRAGNPFPADHTWFVLETRTGRVLFSDRTCRGARSWAHEITGARTSRVRAGLYGVWAGGWFLTVTTRDEAVRRQQPRNLRPDGGLT